MRSAAHELAALRDGAAASAAPQVLIADDDPDILFLLARLLQREGYAVVRA
jgi:CheY-like chemotaxis protein